jgi:O-antigen/teichoic acid export membrane protein
MSNTSRVAKNSFWYSLEIGFGAATMLVTSIFVSRIFGPERLGYYNYIVWLTYVTGVLGTVGLPQTALKFMSEHLSKDEPGTAYLIYRLAWRLQLVLTLALLSAALPAVWWIVPAEHRWMTIFLVLGIAPRMIGFIPAQINSVSQQLHLNVPSTLTANLVTIAIIFATIRFDWGLLGLAISHPIGHSVDLALKLILTAPRRKLWKSALAPGATLAPALRGRMRTFAVQGLGLLLLNLVVWDRSDIFLLRHLNPDLSQVTFFSYSFTLVEKLLLVPQVLAGTMGLNLLAQQKLDSGRMAATAVVSGIYLLLVGLPVMLGAAALSRPLWMIYGDKFAPAAPVFVIMATLAVARTVQSPATVLLQATENQAFLLRAGLLCAAVNLGIDVLLIPVHGALGAAIGNGTGQMLSAAVVWVFIARKFSPDMRYGMIARILASGIVMAGVVIAMTRWLPPVAGSAAGVMTGMFVYVAMLRLTRALRQEDRDRLQSLAAILPERLRYPFNRLLWTVIPNAPAG